MFMKFSVKIMLLEATNTTLDFFLLTPHVKMEQSVLKHRHVKFRCQGVTQKKEDNIGLELAWHCWVVLL